MTYTVLVETLNHALSINQFHGLYTVSADICVQRGPDKNTDDDMRWYDDTTLVCKRQFD